MTIDALKWSYPDVDSGVKPLGGRVLVQLRRIKKTTAGGIVLVNEVREHEKYNTQTAKVIALGQLAFKKKDTLEPWPEGVWADAGDFVRVPKYGGDRFEVQIESEPDEPALFMLINDHELIAKVTGDPVSGFYDCVTH